MWEAAAWWQAALALRPDLPGAAGSLRRIRGRLSPEVPRVLRESNPAECIDLSSLPLPNWSRASAAAADTGAPGTSGVRFEEVAEKVGIDFRYFNGSEPVSEGKLIYQNLGGGVGAIDYDGDGLPDLYFTQGAPKPPDDVAVDHPYADRLYRNIGAAFLDVTTAAGLGDRRHTLGLAAGDLDNDGFPDLYLANAGTNRLYRNNGDGTFTDITPRAELFSSHCTASCLIADLNGDGWPDLYDVNYLAEPDVYKLTCFKDGKDRSCDPRLFAAEPDQMFLSLGD